jgi:aminoglycoside phosphotransferase family enzyme
MGLASKLRLAEKVAFLSDGRNYAPAAGRVHVLETHMSWVFLTEAHAWKLKKPQRVDGIDLGTAEARRRHCLAELRLNRRLAGDVYIDVVALRLRDDGTLGFGDEGEPVEWLLRMRRLPGELMLDRMIVEGKPAAAAVREAARMLGRFYAACPAELADGDDWRARQAARIAANLHELNCWPHLVDRHAVRELAGRQHAFLATEAGLFDERARAGRIVEGHGDLRAEHVCLEDPPRVIDCLEFSRTLRIVDPAEELGFLALDCERLGGGGLRDEIFGGYEEATGDAPDPRLVHFHQSLHAATRAWLALRHLRDAACARPRHWPELARLHLRMAEEHLALCATPKL